MDWELFPMDTRVLVFAVIIIILLGLGIYSVSADNEDDSPGAVNKRALDGVLTSMYKDGEHDYPARLMVLGNVNADDVIDDTDLELAKAIVGTDYDYVESYMADANYDGLIDENDIVIIGQLIDHNGFNGVVNYINCDFKVRQYDMSVPLRTSNILTQTLQMLCILAPESVVAVDDRCTNGPTAHGTYWKEFASVLDYSKLGSVGSHKSPNAEKYLMVARQYGDGYLTAVMNSEYAQNTGYMEEQLQGSSVQIIRIPSWERGAVDNGMLTLGFLIHRFDTAYEWVKWHDSYMDAIMEKVATLTEDQRVKAAVAVLSDTDTSEMDHFDMNYYASGEFLTLNRLGVINIGDKYLKELGASSNEWSVTISKEQFVSMYQKYGLDVFVGTIAGPYNVAPFTTRTTSVERIYEMNTTFLDEYCDGVPQLQIYGWEYALGPHDLTYVASLANVLYGWTEFDVETIVNESLQWMNIYGTGEYQYTYRDIVHTTIYPNEVG